MWGFFFKVSNRFLFLGFQVIGFRPVKRRNRAGSSRNESDYSRTGVPRSVSRFSKVAVERISDCLIAHFSIFFLQL